jgi:hypothetical protein
MIQILRPPYTIKQSSFYETLASRCFLLGKSASIAFRVDGMSIEVKRRFRPQALDLVDRIGPNQIQGRV